MGKLPGTLAVFALRATLCAVVAVGALTPLSAQTAPPAQATSPAPRVETQPAETQRVDGDTAGEKDKVRPSVDSDAVYYGDSKHFKKPAEVDPDQIYAEIEEYQEIIENDLKPGDAKYAILLQKASRRFLKAVRKSARADGYDLIARQGSVKDAGTVPDVTQSVIDRL